MTVAGTRASPPRARARSVAAALVLLAAGRETVASARPFVVAVDPGHGGSNLGAAGVAGTAGSKGPIFEKRVTLELARRLRARLSSDERVQVVLCRDEDVLIPIRARARCVQAARADLFISLHANASPPGVVPGTRRGFEIYILSPQEIEDDAALAAARQPDDADGAWEAHRVRGDAVRAAGAARLMERHLRDTLGPGSSRGIRQRGAALDVLREAGAPGILIEVGFLDHPDESAALASPNGQERIAAALAKAVLEFRSEFVPEHR
ncbi:MAG TPA: N-acetylmuramoyl-L-alanine amidase [Polyangia bacterium]|nr:N-acetylmuramoyl-L-alanine amidase [Polyangia bacterium]